MRLMLIIQMIPLNFMVKTKPYHDAVTTTFKHTLDFRRASNPRVSMGTAQVHRCHQGAAGQCGTGQAKFRKEGLSATPVFRGVCVCVCVRWMVRRARVLTAVPKARVGQIWGQVGPSGASG